MEEKGIEAGIGQRIRAARLQKKMSQADLSFEAGVSLPHISDIELGKKEMHISTFVKIVEALNVSADDILRPSTPKADEIRAAQLSELLEGCTAKESEAILKVVKEIKAVLIAQRETKY